MAGFKKEYRSKNGVDREKFIGSEILSERLKSEGNILNKNESDFVFAPSTSIKEMTNPGMGFIKNSNSGSFKLKKTFFNQMTDPSIESNLNTIYQHQSSIHKLEPIDRVVSIIKKKMGDKSSSRMESITSRNHSKLNSFRFNDPESLLNKLQTLKNRTSKILNFYYEYSSGNS